MRFLINSSKLSYLFLSVSLIMIIFSSHLVFAVADIKEGELGPEKPFSMEVQVSTGEEIVIEPVIFPHSISSKVEVRILKQEGFTLERVSSDVSSVDYLADSRKLNLVISPRNLSSFILSIKSSTDARYELKISRRDVFDVLSNTDAGEESPDAIPIGPGILDGHIAGFKERLNTIDTTFMDEQDWFIISPPADSKFLVRVIPKQSSRLMFALFTSDGRLLFSRDAEYVNERLNALVTTKSKSDFYVIIGSAENVTSGGDYSIDYSIHPIGAQFEEIVNAKQVGVTPIIEEPTHKILQRFWHVLLLSIIGMVIIAGVSVHHMHRKSSDLDSYVKTALHRGYSPALVKQSLKLYHYGDQDINRALRRSLRK